MNILNTSDLKNLIASLELMRQDLVDNGKMEEGESVQNASYVIQDFLEEVTA